MFEQNVLGKNLPVDDLSPKVSQYLDSKDKGNLSLVSKKSYQYFKNERESGKWKSLENNYKNTLDYANKQKKKWFSKGCTTVNLVKTFVFFGSVMGSVFSAEAASNYSHTGNKVGEDVAAGISVALGLLAVGVLASHKLYFYGQAFFAEKKLTRVQEAQRKQATLDEVKTVDENTTLLGLGS